MAEHSRLTANLAAAGLLLAIGGGALAWQRPWESTTSSPAPPIPADARGLLVRTFHDLTAARNRSEFVSAAGRSSAARRTGADIWSARRELDVRKVAFAYRRGGQAPERADGTTSAVVDVTWERGSSTVRFWLRPRTDGFDLESVAGYGEKALPVWLAGKVSLAGSADVTVVSIDGGHRDVDASELGRSAVRATRGFVPAAARRLTIVVPASERSAAAVLGRRPRDIAQVAAVSTRLDGSSGPPAIVLNPRLFAAMDSRARRVVMAHEATHVLSGIVGRDVELWVAEGFADYVALRNDRAPLSVSAGQILRRVKDSGPPRSLPDAKEFDESAHGLSAAYESAWMAFRMLGEQFGDEAVRDFYGDVVTGQPVESAARQRFGLTIGEITSRWRSYLTKSASTVS